MNKENISYTIEGPDKNHKHLELSVFVEKIKHFRNMLKSSAKESGEEGVVFHVVHLSHSSPVVIECRPVGKNNNFSAAALATVNKNLKCVEEGKTDYLSEGFLADAEQLTRVDPTKVARAEIQTIEGDSGEKTVYKLDDSFSEKLRKARNEEEIVINTIDGKLEQINIHNKANTFKIYTSLPIASSVTCKFPQELIKQVQDALGSFVSASGRCFYRPTAILAYKIEVQEMTVLPPTEELPSLSDLYGIAPDVAGDKSPEKSVRELRDDWDKNIR